MNNLLKLLHKFRAILTFVALEIIAFMLIFNNTYYPQTQMYGLMQRFQNYIYTTFGTLTEYLVIKEDNARLVAENAALHTQLRAHRQNADTLKSYTAAIARHLYNYYPAKVVNSSINKQYNYLSINIGENSGIHRNMGVVEGGNVVGFVVNTSAHFATVMPLVNRHVKLSARLKRSGHIGSLTWDGVYYRTALLIEVPQHADIAVGDTVVTSGFSAMFPEGILIGTVVDYHIRKGSYYEINVRLATDLNQLRYVNVIENTMQIERQILEEQNNF
jgi:rod shape-determining protein MreC